MKPIIFYCFLVPSSIVISLFSSFFLDVKLNYDSSFISCQIPFLYIIVKFTGLHTIIWKRVRIALIGAESAVSIFYNHDIFLRCSFDPVPILVGILPTRKMGQCWACIYIPCTWTSFPRWLINRCFRKYVPTAFDRKWAKCKIILPRLFFILCSHT